MTHNLPPQDIETEQSILCSVLLGDMDPLEILQPDDFYRTAHQVAFRAAVGLNDKNQKIDLLTIKTALKESGQLEQVGGASFLAGILDNPLAINIENACRIVREKSIRRRLLIVAQQTAQKVYEEQDTAKLVDDVQQAALSIDSHGPGQDCFILKNRLMAAAKRWEMAKTKGSGVGLMSGFADLYQLTGGFQEGDLVIIAGRPSMGKSALALTVGLSMAERNIPGAFFSLEMSSVQIEDRIVSMASRVNGKKFTTGGFSKENWVSIMRVMENAQEWPFYYDDTPGISYQEVRQKARRWKKQHNIQFLIVDYLQLMAGDKGKDVTREREIASITAAMKATAKELRIPVILLSQLNRGLEMRKDKRPMLSDLRESGAIEQDADVVMFLYRDEYYNENSTDKGIAEVIVAKQRNGPTGKVKLKWMEQIAKFENLERGHADNYFTG